MSETGWEECVFLGVSSPWLMAGVLGCAVHTISLVVCCCLYFHNRQIARGHFGRSHRSQTSALNYNFCFVDTYFVRFISDMKFTCLFQMFLTCEYILMTNVCDLEHTYLRMLQFQLNIKSEISYNERRRLLVNNYWFVNQFKFWVCPRKDRI